MEYFNRYHYPDHFILIGTDPLFFETEAEAIVVEAAARYPNEFLGECPAFSFQLRYTAPYEKNFDELRRLQGTASGVYAGRRHAYRGYIILDVSAYLQHEQERYFGLFLDYLYDQSDGWKYIFLVRSESGNVCRSLVRRLLTIPRCSILEQSRDRSFYHRQFLDRMFQQTQLSCCQTARSYLEQALDGGICTRDGAAVLLREIAGRRGIGHRISMKTLRDYFDSGPASMKYMLGAREYQAVLSALGQRKKEEEEIEQTT